MLKTVRLINQLIENTGFVQKRNNNNNNFNNNNNSRNNYNFYT